MWHFSNLNLMGSLSPTLHCLTAALRHNVAPCEAVVAVEAWSLGRRSGLPADYYCCLSRTKAYAKHYVWSRHELCNISLPLGIAGGFTKYLPLISKGKNVLFAFPALNHYLFLGLLLFIQPIDCSRTAEEAECDKCQSPWIH